jgi:hypothetical protein
MVMMLAAIGFVSTAQASLGVAGSPGIATPFPNSAQNEINAPEGVAVNSSGNGGVPIGTTYVAENKNGRISQFDPAGNFVRAFGGPVVASGEDDGIPLQRLSVDATAGDYRLRLISGTATGHLTNGSNQVTQFSSTSGVFHVGDGVLGAGIPAGTTVTAIGAGALQLSAAATEGGDPTIEAIETTGDISATASVAVVEAALESLPAISGGEDVSVSGGPGNAGATTPYVVASGPNLTTVSGTTPLSGGAATVEISLINSFFGDFEVCNASPPSDDVCQGSFVEYRGVAVDQATGNVYALQSRRGLEFSPTGTFIRAFGHNVVASGPHNVTPTSAEQSLDIPATVTGGFFTLKFGGDMTGSIAYDASAATVETELRSLASIGFANVNVTGGDGTVAPFIVTFAGELANNPEPSIEVDSTNLVGGLGAVSIIKAGTSASEICLPIDTCKGGTQFDTGGGAIGDDAGPFGAPVSGRLTIAPPGTPNEGNVLIAEPANRRVQEFTPSGEFIRAFGFDVTAAGPNDNGTGFEECRFGDACKAGTSGSGLGQFASLSPSDIAEDSTGAIYTVEGAGNFRVQKFSPQVGPVELSPAIFGSNGAPNGTSTENGPARVAVGSSDHVFVVKSFPAGATATCPNGLPSKAESRVQELTADGTTLLDTQMACNEIPRADGLGINLSSGNLFVSVSSPFLSGFVPRVYFLGATGPPSAALSSVSEETKTGAKVVGFVNPNVPPLYANPPKTSYHLEYKLSSSSAWTQYVPDISVGSGASNVSVTVFLNGLEPNRTYDVRLVATKQFGEGVVASAPQTFTTLPSPPSITAFSTSHVTANSADLHAEINPLGQDTTYRFEYGTSSSYGSTAPIPAGQIAATPNPQQITTHLTGLDAVGYHFRVVAENDSGVTTSGDQIFSFYPLDCPNSHIRAQTGASFLPDCRAYELVSPANAANVRLVPVGPFAPGAVNPPRFAFAGAGGFIEGTGEPAAIGEFGHPSDVYVATRRSDGWVTRYVGIPASQRPSTGGLPSEGFGNPEGVHASLDLGKILNWDTGQRSTVATLEGSYAPYMWEADGSSLGRLPSNLAQVSGAELDLAEGGYVGDAEVSPDFSHYFFSTKDLEFAPGGLTVAPGSAYVNDVETGTVTLISKTPLGADIPQDTGDVDEYIKFTGVSTDGSHVLMSTKAADGTTHLYMAVDATEHYDVSIGQDGLNHGVKYVGMTADGSTVYFSSNEQLSADDNDSSTDLFMWSEDSPGSVTRISAGSGGGNSDICSATWTQGCNVAPISTGVKTDNAIASASGDIYFLSPEQLEVGKGVPGEGNLYMFRNGQAEFVTTLFDTTAINRIQVSPTNDHMALITTADLTQYEAGGHREMYSFSPSSGLIQCVSCIPNGSAPSHDVAGSQNGIFMADDGRTFFGTADALVPQDTNGVLDVYEFVDNRPQLISSGTANEAAETGLVGVSTNGIDVYFSTLDTFVGQDTVGPFLKFYDARTGGGIPLEPPPVPCAAADECHGPGSVAPSRIISGTGAPLGASGNLKSTARKHQKKTQRHRRQHRKHRQSARGKGGSRG